MTAHFSGMEQALQYSSGRVKHFEQRIKTNVRVTFDILVIRRMSYDWYC